MPNYANTSKYTEEEIRVWNEIIAHEGKVYFTFKRLRFKYTVKGNELFVSRKRKSITRAAVNKSLQLAKEVMAKYGFLTGPKQIGTFGASYLFPILKDVGYIIVKQRRRKRKKEVRTKNADNSVPNIRSEKE